jgi:hypothetical protein
MVPSLSISFQTESFFREIFILPALTSFMNFSWEARLGPKS